MHGNLDQVATALAPEIVTSSPLGRGWYVAYCEVRAEFRVARELKAKGFDTFLPCETVIRSIRGRRTKISRPIFSRYVFVGFDPEREEWWNPIRSTDGVHALLENNHTPVRIPSQVVRDLQLAEANGAFDKNKLPIAGQEYRVVDGPLAGLIGRVKNARASGRIKLLVKMLGSLIAAEFTVAQLERIS